MSQDAGKQHERMTFEVALENQRDVTESFFIDFGRDIDLEQEMSQSDSIVRSKVRSLMEKPRGTSGYLFNLKDMAAPEMALARTLLDEGSVAAVDGTNALEPLDLMNTGYYACAVGYVTSRVRSTPQVFICETSTRYQDAQKLKAASSEDLIAISEELDAAREQSSWQTTFREYQERTVAMNCDAPVVFIDGPIFTQNLVTQPRGRALYDQMEKAGKTYIGVIKDLTSSWALCKWCGYSLDHGEGYVICPIRSQFTTRFKESKRFGSGSDRPGDPEPLPKWVDRMSDEYVRVVFRPNQKAFAFECRRKDLGLATALLLADASETIHHELPLLLEIVDAQLRTGFNAGTARQVLTGRLQQVDYLMGIDVMNERDLR